MTSVHLAFSVSSGDSNSGPLACKASFLIHGTISLALFLWIFDPATALCFSLLMNIDFSTSYQMLCFMVCVCGGGDTGILNFILYQMQSNKGMWLFLFFFVTSPPKVERTWCQGVLVSHYLSCCSSIVRSPHFFLCRKIHYFLMSARVYVSGRDCKSLTAT